MKNKKKIRLEQEEKIRVENEKIRIEQEKIMAEQREARKPKANLKIGEDYQ